jgi:chromosomal replication initiator protein
MPLSTPYPSEEVEKVWTQARSLLKQQLSPAVFNTWIMQNPLTSMEQTNNMVTGTITCATAFHAANIKKNLYSQLKSSLEQQLQKPIELSFVVGNPLQQDLSSPLTKDRKKPKKQIAQNSAGSPTVDELFSQHNISISAQDRVMAKARAIGLRLDYTFKTFAVSTSNEMAHAAATAVSNAPGVTYNPLFFYGGVGVGKTHLMHAIAHNVLKNNPDISIIYCTGEEFTNEIVSAIQKKKALQFKDRFRKANILLIDDIQFIAGKNAVQEEFFHTFNALIKQSSQIILTSDRPPHEINLMEPRLRSRFEAGLMIDIQQPSFELRTAILLIKAQSNNIDLSMDLAQQIAEKVDSARKIEGIINQIKSEAELKKEVIDQAMIERILSLESKKKTRIIKTKPQDIIKLISSHYNVKQSAVKGQRRTKELVAARHAAMFFLKTELQMPLEEIGTWFSNRDHTSVLHAVKKIEKLIETNEQERQDFFSIKRALVSS